MSDPYPPSDQASLHYQWYLDECASSEKLRVEIAVLKRNQKVKPTKKSEKELLRKQTIIGVVGVITIAVFAVSTVIWLATHG